MARIAARKSSTIAGTDCQSASFREREVQLAILVHASGMPAVLADFFTHLISIPRYGTRSAAPLPAPGSTEQASEIPTTTCAAHASVPARNHPSALPVQHECLAKQTPYHAILISRTLARRLRTTRLTSTTAARKHRRTPGDAAQTAEQRSVRRVKSLPSNALG